jgi:ribA/ribD-fused uncharacterized protein
LQYLVVRSVADAGEHRAGNSLDQVASQRGYASDTMQPTFTKGTLVPSPRNVDELRQWIVAGRRLEYVLFLAPEPTAPGVLGSECLSQWYPSEMQVDSVRFPTAEHYMMWRKARLFGDSAIEQRLLADDSPAVAKQLGRAVRNFRGDIWDRHRFDVVLQGSLIKFQQNERLRRYLLDTADAILAEASPVDNIWGVGFEANDPRAQDPLRWTGVSLLGFALMQARDQLAATRA